MRGSAFHANHTNWTPAFAGVRKPIRPRYNSVAPSEPNRLTPQALICKLPRRA
jgi:hypothetical protein